MFRNETSETASGGRVSEIFVSPEGETKIRESDRFPPGGQNKGA